MTPPSAYVCQFAAAFVAMMCVFASAGAEPALMSEPNRPQFHYTPQKNWLNDPNGLVFQDGQWHLFHQYNPEGIESANKSWAHAVSRDLVHWEHLPLAIRYGDGIEIWSGSAVVDADNTSGFGTKDNPPLIALYTGAGHNKQAQYLAYSTDRGRTWTKYPGNPVIDENLRDFRDPKVFWHAATRRWVMAVALSDQRKVRFYASADLKQWTQLSEFGGQGSVEGIWECPDLVPLALGNKTHWVLFVSVGGGGPAGGTGVQYFVGDFDGTAFHNANDKGVVLWADHGPDFYAPQTWSNVPSADGRTVWIGWMSTPRYAGDEPTRPWRGAMSLPRELSLVETKDGPRLAQLPVRELAKLRGAVVPESQYATAGQQLEIEAVLDATRPGSLLVCHGGEAATVIGYRKDKRLLYVDRSASRRGEADFHPAFPEIYRAALSPGAVAAGEVALRIFVDRTSVEVFADGGAAVITANTFPRPDRISLSVAGDVVKSMKVWRLESIWNDKE